MVPCCPEVSVILSTGMLSVLLVQEDEAFELEGNFKRQYLFQNGAESSQLHFEISTYTFILGTLCIKVLGIVKGI